MAGRISRALVLVVGAWILACGPDRTPDAPPDRPNVLIVVLDTTRADVFGCTGHAKRLTPRIDALASEGTLFRRAYATDFWTLPSHASLLTGLYPTQSQATSETNRLPEGIETLAERLRAQGYATGAVVRNAWISAERGFDQGFEDFIESWREKRPDPVAAERAAADRAATWIEEHATEPFFLFVNLNIAHLPYRPTPEVWERVRGRSWRPGRVARLRRITGMWAHLAGAVRLDADDLACLRELYEAEIAHADELVGRILDALERSGISERTLVVLTSDHGENLGEHGLIDHLLSMYETTIRVPLILRFPGRFPAGAVRDDLASLVDVTPTALELCGLSFDPENERFLGRDLTGRTPAPDHVIAENDRPRNGVLLLRKQFPRFDVSTIDHPVRTLVTPREKLVWHVGRGTELYDLADDPEETRDLAASRPEVRDALLSRMQRLTGTLRRGMLKVEPLESRDPAALERLRALTYLR